METIEVLETLEILKEENGNGVPPSEKKRSSRLDRGLFRVLLALVFLVPLFFAPLLGVSLEFEKALFIALGIGLCGLLWILGRLGTGLYSIPKTPLLFAGLLIVVAFVLSSLFSSVPQLSFSGAAFESGTAMAMFILFLTFFFSSVSFQSERRVEAFYKALLFSFAVLFIYHSFRILFGADVLSFGLFTNPTETPIGRWNDFGIFAGMVTLFSIVALEFGHLGRMYRRSVYTILVVAILTLAVVNFSFLWIIVGSFSLILAVYIFTMNQGERNQTLFTLATPSLFVLIISILFIIGGGALGSSVSNLTGTPQLEVRPSWESTLGIVADVWRGEPLFGNGPNRFAHAWSLYKPEAITSTPFWNTIFDAGVGTLPSYAVTVGFLGVLAFIFFLAVYLYQGIRMVFFEGVNVHYFTLSLFLVSLYLWIVAFFYTPSTAILFLTFATTGVFVAFGVSRGYIHNFNLTHTRDARVGFVSVLILIVLLVGVVDLEYVVAQKSISLYQFHNAAQANAEGDRSRAQEYLLRANALNESDRFYRAGAELQLADLNELLTKENAQPDEIRVEFQQMLGNAIRSAQGAVSYDETNYLNWLALFQVYGNVVRLNVVEGAYENAQESLLRAQLLNPNNPTLLLREAELELAAGESASAREALERALIMKEDYTDAIFLLAQLEIQEGNTRQAITSLQQASLIDPNNISLFFSLGLLEYNERNFIRAIEALERVVFLNPQYSNAKYYLGLSYYEAAREQDALSQFEEVLALNPGNELVLNILDNLENGVHPLSGVGGRTQGESIGPPLQAE